MDYFGNGQIGNLRENSLEEIFSGEPARNLRERLYNGELPIPECRGCPELAELEEGAGSEVLEAFEVPKRGLMVENTVVCNLKCLHCNRVDLMKTRGQKVMSLDDIRLISKTFHKHGIEKMHFFNLGEPFLSKRVNEELSIIRAENPDVDINTSTNGMLLDSDLKRDAALKMNHIFFSIDGCDQETAARYQVGMSFEKALENMKKLISYRNDRGLSYPFLEWKYVVFEWNCSKQQIAKAVSLAEQVGVDMISFFRGGGEGALSVAEFVELDSLRVVGTSSWRGREIDFTRYDFNRADRMIERYLSEGDAKACSAELASCFRGTATSGVRDLVRACYELVLRRAPDEEGHGVYVDALTSGELTSESLIEIFLGSGEFRDRFRK